MLELFQINKNTLGPSFLLNSFYNMLLYIIYLPNNIERVKKNLKNIQKRIVIKFNLQRLTNNSINS